MATWQSPENFARWLFFVILFIFLLVSVLILFTRLYFVRILAEQEKLQKTILLHQEQLLKDSILVQEHERTRIAADLHDVLISKLNISLLLLTTNQDTPKTISLLQNSINVARQISHDLSPPLLEESSLDELIEDFVAPLEDSYTLIFHKNLKQKMHLPKNIKLQVFRICQEVFNNIIKHAQANQIKVKISLKEQLLIIEIRDNGIGFVESKIHKGLGFKNITLRSQVIGSTFSFQTPSSSGTSFLLSLKLDKDA